MLEVLKECRKRITLLRGGGVLCLLRFLPLTEIHLRFWRELFASCCLWKAFFGKTFGRFVWSDQLAFVKHDHERSEFFFSMMAAEPGLAFRTQVTEPLCLSLLDTNRGC